MSHLLPRGFARVSASGTRGGLLSLKDRLNQPLCANLRMLAKTLLNIENTVAPTRHLYTLYNAPLEFILTRKQHFHCSSASVTAQLLIMIVVAIIYPIAIAHSMGQIIKSVCVCQSVSVSVCEHSHGRIS